MVNRTFGNRYQVTEKIGVGGMAEVYKATDSTLGRTVAIKVMLPQYAADPNFAARFRQEAQAAANLNSPYIVNIYDWGKDGDSYYIVMEYVRGTDLRTAIHDRGLIHPRKVAEIGSQVCSALSVAHGYDIIHRDIKSANIMVQGDGNVKVMDFGIAQAGRPGMTQSSSVLGTANYVSPEQAQGKRLTGASDLYSLGIVMYEACTGQLPFDGPDVVSVAMKQVNETPVPPRQINPDIDPQLDAIIMRALEKNPENRFATAQEMKTELDNYLTGRSSSSAPTQVIGSAYAASGADATTVMNPAAETTVLNKDAQSSSKNSKKKSGRGKKIAIAVVVIVLLVAAGIAVVSTTDLFSSSQVTVPSVTGKTEAAATETLEESGLKVGTIAYETSDTVEEGMVISQDPEANTTVDKNSSVNLTVSSGSESANLVSVPNLTGLTAAEAERQLSAVGLVGASEQASSDSYEAGKVFSQDPAGYSQVPVGSTVTYTISTGKETKTVTVPNLKGIEEADAVATLERMGLVVQTQEGRSDEVAEGSVCDQSIASGTQVTTGTTIVLTIATGGTSISVPNVIGSSESSATATLRNAGFSVSVRYAEGTNNEVISQSPSAGSSAREGDTITITVGTGTSGDTE